MKEEGGRVGGWVGGERRGDLFLKYLRKIKYLKVYAYV